VSPAAPQLGYGYQFALQKSQTAHVADGSSTSFCHTYAVSALTPLATGKADVTASRIEASV
jgi:hypothetical protein